MKKLICTGLFFVILTLVGFFINRLLSLVLGANLIEVIIKHLSLFVTAFLINLGTLRFIEAKKSNDGRIISSGALLTLNLIAVILFLILAVLTYVLMLRNGAYNPTEIYRASAVFTSLSSYFLGSSIGVSFFKRRLEV